MQRERERAGMANDISAGSSSTAGKNPKKANLLNQHSIKRLLDESVFEIVSSKGYPEDVRTSNLRLAIGTIIIAVALIAQFYPKKFPENRDFLVVCIGLCVVLNVLLLLVSYTKEKNAFLFTYPPPGSFHSTGLVVSSKLGKFSDMYTLTIASADAKSLSANKPVQLKRSLTKWFTKDGILVEALFSKDVEKLIDDYVADGKSK